MREIQPATWPTRNWFQAVQLDPQSQCFSRCYGSSLPTSLTYIVQLPEAGHLGDLMRIWVRPATEIILPRWDFQGPTRAFRTPQAGWCFTKARLLSPDNPIPGGGCTPNKEKRTTESLRSSTRVFPGFKLRKHSSPSFGSQRMRSCSALVVHATRSHTTTPWGGPVMGLPSECLLVPCTRNDQISLQIEQADPLHSLRLWVS